MRGLPQTLPRINDDVRRATALIETADACLNKVPPPLSGGTGQTGANPGGRGIVDRGTVSGGTSTGNPPVSGGSAGGGGTSGTPPPSGNGRSNRAPGGGASGSVARDPCLPFGPGGYDYCANPTQPPGCDCTKRSAANGPGYLPICTPNPDVVRQYKREGAYPPLRYQVGFNQGVARCLESQCTLQNLAVAVWAARFQQVRAALAVGATANFIDAVVNPPGFSPSPDPVRSRQRGR